MRSLFLIGLFIFSLSCFSQNKILKANCKFDGDTLEILSHLVKDTTYLDMSLSNEVIDKFVPAEFMRLSYRVNKTETYSKPYEIDTKNKIIDTYVAELYDVFQECLLEYQKFIFNERKDEILNLASNNVSHYYYKINLIILPKED